MSSRSWRLQDAKAQFSAVVEAAMRGEEQHVTRRGQAAVVVVGAEEFERLRHAERAAAPGFIEHLLAMPKQQRAPREAAEPRPVLRLRDLDLS